MLSRFVISAAVLMGTALLSNPAFADTTDTVNLNGTVNSINSVDATDTTEAGTLNLYGEGTAGNDEIVKVADLVVMSNNTGGVTLTATAAGTLGNGTDTLAYNVLIVTEGATPLATDFLADNDSDSVNDFDATGTSNRDLYIEYDAPSLLDPGNYSSTITVSVADN